MTTPKKTYHRPSIDQTVIQDMPQLLSESATIPLNSDGETDEALSRINNFDDDEEEENGLNEE